MRVAFLSSKRIEFIALTFFIIVYFFLSLKDVTLPGLNFDEAFPAAAAIDLLKGRDPDLHVAAATDTTFLGRKLPLMMTFYETNISSYLLIPFFVMFGINVFSLRLSAIIFGAFFLIIIYFFVKKLFCEKTAFVATFLLVTSPNFIFLNRVGYYFPSCCAYISFMLALLFLLKWKERGRILYFVLGVFLLGLSFSSLVCFGALILALAIISLIFLKDIRKTIKQSRIRRFWIYILCGSVFFSLGNFLYIYANFINESTRFMTFKGVAERFLNTGQGINNLNYLRNLVVRSVNFWDLLSENGIAFLREKNVIQPIVFFISFSGLSFSLMYRKKIFQKKRVLFILLLVIISFLASPFAFNGLCPYHLLFLTPYLQLVISAGLLEFYYYLRGRLTFGMSKFLFFLMFLFLIGVNLRILNCNYVALRKTGGLASWSDAIYELADWLKEIGPSKIVALTWGFSRNLYFLFQGEMRVNDIYSSPDFNSNKNEADFVNEIRVFFDERDAKYLLNVQRDDYLNQGTYQFFKKTVNAAGKKLIEEKTFYQRDGVPVYVVYSVK